MEKELSFSLESFERAAESCATLIVGLAADDNQSRDRVAARLSSLNPRVTEQVSAVLASGDFAGKAGRTFVLRPGAVDGPERIVLAGLGAREEYDAEAGRKALAAAAKRASKLSCEAVSIDVSSFALEGVSALQAVELAAEVPALALWRASRYQTQADDEDSTNLTKIELLWDGVEDIERARAAAGRARTVADGTLLARELASRPSNELDPLGLAAQAEEAAGRHGFGFELIEGERLAEMGFNAILAVGSGSASPPCLAVIDTAPGSAQEPVALVGKGITFDSGGISLKPAKDMDHMKGDKAGAAAVVAVVDTLGRLGEGPRVVALVPAAENMPGPASMRPGDVIRAYGGATIEVLNTDAEGRLVLADALAYAVAKYGPAHVVDIATLTGAARVALGEHVSALLGTDDALCGALSEAGRVTHERLWRLPLYSEYEKQVKSSIADVKNTGGPGGGAITAAAFLKRFVGKVRWAHVDIAATSWLKKGSDYRPAGATGVGVRLLVEALTRQWPPAL